MKTIGIIGGGQLGLMIAEQARELGVRTVCLDPAADAPAFNVCDAPAFALSDERIVAAYDDPAALEELCRRSDAVTYEFENVPGEILIPLCGKYNIPQGYKPLYDSQDRLREKSNARDHGLRTPGFEAVDDEASLRAAVAKIGLPAVLKTRTLGYDGHGQLVLRTEADLERALPLLSVPCILEEFVPFDFEASIVMVADRERVVSFPVGRNVHRDGILDLSIVPAGDGAEVVERMRCESERFMRECGYEGILAIEYFVRGGEIYFKTDDDDLFRDSLTYFPASGYDIIWQTYDLHENEPEWNIRTEHEGMFTEMGIKIKALIARKKAGDDSVTWVEPKVLKKLAAQAEAEASAKAEGEGNV